MKGFGHSGGGAQRRLWSLTWVLALGWSVAEGAGPSAPLAVVRSSDSPPYRAVNDSFEASVGQPVKSVSLANASKDELASTVNGATVVLAVGPDAAKVVAQLKPGAAVYALVSSPQKLGLEPQRAVPMFVPPARVVKDLKEMLPSVRRVGIVFDPAQSGPLVAECESALGAAGVGLQKAAAPTRQDVASAVRTLVGKVDALWLIPDTTVISAESFKFMVQTSLESKLPLIGFSEGMSKAGALLSFEAQYLDMGKKAAAAAKRALAGGAPSAEAPEGSIFINAKTAELLDIPLSAQVRGRAAKLFE